MLKLENICYKKDNKLILDNISLTIDDEKLVAITGPNGSGKSTLAKIIMGLIKPTKGKIIFNGEDITNIPLDKRAQKGISYAFQTPVVFNGLTINDLFKAVNKNSTFEDIKKYLGKVGLCAKEYLNRDFDDTLSGGEKKRIEIALILYKNGTLNIYDEPEAGIDLWSFGNLVNIFKEKNKNQSTIIISHQEKILNEADDIIVLNKGNIVEKDKDILLNNTKKPCIKCEEVFHE